MADDVMPAAEPEAGKSVEDQLREQLTQAKAKRRDYLEGWQRNVDERRGKDFDTAADEGRVAVPVDWGITKAKAAQLFSQMPQVRLTPRPGQAEATIAVPVFAKVLNDTLEDAGIESVVSDCVVDCINAAGVGVAVVRYEALTETVQVPAMDDVAAAYAEEEAVLTGVPFEMPMLDSIRTTDRRFCVDRVSPADFLWPKDFHLSDWDKAPWLGHSGRCLWPEAKRMFGLTDKQKEDVLGASAKELGTERLSDPENRHTSTQEVVCYDELFYWRHIYHEDEKSYDAIQRIVFVAGLEQPISEPWKGQQFEPGTGKYLGACLLPVRVLTLAYISDEAIPPSDSAIIRPQVKELQESRTHMKEQRKHSRPLRWFDVDRVDPTITADLLKGTWQGMIPTIGAGDKVIGEVARTAYPRENLEFDRILKADIQEAVSVGPNQQGMFASGERSASEAQIVQHSFQTEIGQQRARVAAFVVGIAEVVAGLYALFGDPTEAFGAEAAQQFAAGKSINQKFLFDVRPDSTVRLDAQQLVEQLKSVLNVTAQSGFINPKPLIQRIIELNGLDPAEVMVDPQPKGPEPPKVSFNFRGEDVINPVVWAILVRANMAPTPEELQAAQKSLAAAGVTPVMPPDLNTVPSAATAQPDSTPDVPGPQYPSWESSPRINTRRSEG